MTALDPGGEADRADAVVVEVSGEPSGRAFWIGLVVGWTVMAVGVWSAVTNASDANPLAIARYLVGFAILHDAVVAPLAFAVGWLATRLLPTTARGPARGAVALSAILLVFSYPLVRRLGARDGNSSALPLDYGRNVLIVVAAVWLVAVAVIALRWWRARRSVAVEATP